MKKYLLGMTCVVAGMLSLLALSGCATAPPTVQGKADIETEVPAFEDLEHQAGE